MKRHTLTTYVVSIWQIDASRNNGGVPMVVFKSNEFSTLAKAREAARRLPTHNWKIIRTVRTIAAVSTE